jgi:hypothetical protein
LLGGGNTACPLPSFAGPSLSRIFGTYPHDHLSTSKESHMTNDSASLCRPRNHRRNGLTALVFLLVSLLLPVACGRQGGPSQQANFVGDWRRLGTSYTGLKIYKTGDTYIVEINANGEGQISKYPAIVRDGQLKLSGPRGETPLVYVASTGHILLDGSEYERNTQR